MSAISFMLITGFGWVVAAIVFEGSFRWLKAKGKASFRKRNGARVYWILMGLFSTVPGLGAFVVGLPLFLVICLPHIYLADRKNEDEIITLTEIVQNIGPALRLAANRIRPFIK